MIWDTSAYRGNKPSITTEETTAKENDKWEVSGVLEYSDGKLKAVAVSETGNLFIGGDSFVACYDEDLNPQWDLKTAGAITSLSADDEIIYASTKETIILIDQKGEIIEEWGPYEANSHITSVSSNADHVAFADAVNKRIFILRKNGEVVQMIGHAGHKFIIPSPYFDVVLTEDNILYAANTGMHKIETWTIDGRLTDSWGVPGLAPDAFCGCCNPAHFALYGDGFVTAEKGLNRIKIADRQGGFVEFVSSANKFIPSMPLDVVAHNDKIYGANTADSKLYVFKRKLVSSKE